MSIHPSLAATDKSSKTRTVLKRTERLKMMMEKNQWKEGDDIYRLPKIKTVRIIIKKEKAAVEKTDVAAAAAGTAPAEAAAAKPGAAKSAAAKPAGKEAAPVKGAAAKQSDKK